MNYQFTCMCIDSEQLITSSVFCFFSFFFTTIISDEILQLHLLILQLEMFVFLPLELLVEISLLGGEKTGGVVAFHLRNHQSRLIRSLFLLLIFFHVESFQTVKFNSTKTSECMLFPFANLLPSLRLYANICSTIGFTSHQ